MAKLTSDVLDERDDAQVCLLQFRIFGRRLAIEGRIRTLRCFEDNSLLKATLAAPSDGEVLVVDGGGSLRTALMGDMVATSALRNGWSGVILNGAIRDSVQIGAMDFHVKSLGTNPRKSSKQGVGQLDAPVEFGGARFVTGEYLYSDEDGIVVVSTG
ncbi:MAG: ribonuclease E activity regulator RraA [Acidobacteriota bacterium]|nr:ribonuclease E activity regulator RraA [Acidobacteriota bacterium]